MRLLESRAAGLTLRFLPWLGAVLMGALVPAALGAGRIEILPVAFAITLGHTVILGGPVALLCSRRRWTGLAPAIIAGAVIGALPSGFVGWPLSPSMHTSGSVDGVTTIVDGFPTLAGWIQYGEYLSVFAGLGAIGAVAFWLTLRVSGTVTAVRSAAAPPKTPTRGQTRRGILMTGLAVSCAMAVAAIPSATKDRSCHNIFRDGRTSASPTLLIDLKIELTDWPHLTELLTDFAREHKMSFRDSSETRPGTIEILSISLCTDQGLIIGARDQHWEIPGYGLPLKGRGVTVEIMDLNETATWLPLARDLVDVFEAAWPDRVRFRIDGRLAPKPKILAAPTTAPETETGRAPP